ncbi:MAG TPA: hypothetical protein VF997_06820 [Polyangia bacterium]
MKGTFTMIGVVALLVGGCGSNGNNGSGGNGGSDGGGSGMDLAAPPGSDLAMTLPADMQPAYGCHALAACVAGCTTQACFALCAQSSTMQALTMYQALRSCERKECYPHPDAGPAPCTQGGGTPTPQCTMCLGDVIKATGSCGADTTYCGTCYMQYSACQANLP